MDRVLVIHLLTENPNANAMQAHSHFIVNFKSEKQCADALNAMRAEF